MGPPVTEMAHATPRGASMNAAMAWATARLHAAGVETARLDAECLLASCLGCDRLHLYAAGAGSLPAAVLTAYRDRVRRREHREPLAYLIGVKEFWSLAFAVTPAVLIPRPETESLVAVALDALAGSASPVVADVGTGSGAIAVTVAHALRGVRVYATEISTEALALARANASAHGVSSKITFLQGDLLAPLWARGLAGRCDLIVSNPPYVATEELAALPPEVRCEPLVALHGGPDGLDLHRRIIAGAPALLRSGGWLVVEMAPVQGEALVQLLRDRGVFGDIAVVPDVGGRQRAVTARYTGRRWDA